MDILAKYQIPPSPPFNNELNILVAESNNELRLIILHALQKSGFSKVKGVRSGLDAVAELKLKSAQVVLASDELKDVVGLELIKEMRESDEINRCAFVLISKALQRSEAMLAIESGVDDFLFRPLSISDVIPKIKSAFAAFNNTKNPELLYELAKRKFREKDVTSTIEIYEGLSKSAPGAARPHVGLAKIYQHQNQLNESLSSCNLAISKNSNYTHAYLQKAKTLVALTELDEAYLSLKKAIELSPLNISRYEYAVQLLVPLEKFQICVELLEIGTKNGVEHPFVVERLGYCLFRLKEYAKATKYLKQACRLEPENVSFLNSLAVCFRDAKQYDESVEIYNSILRKENDNYQVLFNKSLVLVLMGKKEEALKILKRVVKINPAFDKAIEKLAQLEQGDH